MEGRQAVVEGRQAVEVGWQAVVKGGQAVADITAGSVVSGAAAATASFAGAGVLAGRQQDGGKQNAGLRVVGRQGTQHGFPGVRVSRN